MRKGLPLACRSRLLISVPLDEGLDRLAYLLVGLINHAQTENEKDHAKDLLIDCTNRPDNFDGEVLLNRIDQQASASIKGSGGLTVLAKLSKIDKRTMKVGTRRYKTHEGVKVRQSIMLELPKKHEIRLIVGQVASCTISL